MADYRMVLVFQIPYGISIATWKIYSSRMGSLLLNRTVLGFQIPYGILIATWEIYIATYRTGLSFEPYGITTFVHFERHFT